MKTTRVHLVLACVVIGAGAMLADSPLPKPHRVAGRSPNGNCSVVSDPEDGTSVYRKPEKILWKIPQWYRAIWISNRCDLAIAPSGNLLPLNYRPDQVLIETWRDGGLRHSILVRDLVPDLKDLRRTAPHYQWGSILGFDDNNRLVVVTKRAKVRIDPDTGNQER